jgi:uncharacterized membrane protein
MRLPSPRSLGIGLLASCTVNLFLGGLLVGGLLRGHVVPHGRVGGPPPNLEWIRRALGSEEMPALDAVAARHGTALRERTLELREARRTVDRRLEDGPYDARALAAALADVGDRSAALQAQLSAALVELADGLTPEQRKRLVEVRRSPGLLRQTGPTAAVP